MNTFIEEKLLEYTERFMETDVYPNDLIPKNDVMATKELVKSFLRHSLEECWERAQEGNKKDYMTKCGYCSNVHDNRLVCPRSSYKTF